MPASKSLKALAMAAAEICAIGTTPSDANDSKCHLSFNSKQVLTG